MEIRDTPSPNERENWILPSAVQGIFRMMIVSWNDIRFQFGDSVKTGRFLKNILERR